MTRKVTSAATPEANPFPPAAVASLSTRGWVSVPTPAWDQARQNVEDYLAAPEQSGSNGRTVAIVGEFGTGKTHLALEMLRMLEVMTDGNCTQLYLDAPGESFVSLYRDRFLPLLDRRELRQRVLEYYADVVAEELADSEITAETVVALRDGRLNPEAVVDRFALAPTRLLHRLRERLREVTEQPQFATALTLFLRPEYEATVWQWLGTATPDPVLVERGVSKTIETDVDALEAIGVVALLYGRRGHRFALALDELEKVLVPLADLEGGGDVLISLKRLMQIFARTGALLILCGLPDYFDLFPKDTRDRIADVIRPTRLNGDDTQRYIEDSQERVFGEARLAPFTTESAAYVASIGAGNPRRIIRLCYLLYRVAHERGVPVTRGLVREVAKEQFETASLEDVARDLTEVLDRHGWLFERQKRLGKPRGARVDFWIPLGDEGSGCAVLLVNSILDPAEAKRLVARVTSLEKAGSDAAVIETMVVVNGRIADEANDVLSAVPIRSFEYGVVEFRDSVDAALTGVFQRFERSQQDLTLDALADRMEQLSRQVSSIYRMVEDMSNRSSSQDFESAAEAGLRRVFLSVTPPSPQIPRDFPAVRGRFRAIRAMLEQLREAAETSEKYIASALINESERVLEVLEGPVQGFEAKLARHLRSMPATATVIDRLESGIFSEADDDLRRTWERYGTALHALELTGGAVEELGESYVTFVRRVYDAVHEDVYRTR